MITLEELRDRLHELRDAVDSRLAWGERDSGERGRLTYAANAIELATECLAGRAEIVCDRITRLD